MSYQTVGTSDAICDTLYDAFSRWPTNIYESRVKQLRTNPESWPESHRPSSRVSICVAARGMPSPFPRPRRRRHGRDRRGRTSHRTLGPRRISGDKKGGAPGGGKGPSPPRPLRARSEPGVRLRAVRAPSPWELAPRKRFLRRKTRPCPRKRLRREGALLFSSSRLGPRLWRRPGGPAPWCSDRAPLLHACHPNRPSARVRATREGRLGNSRRDHSSGSLCGARNGHDVLTLDSWPCRILVV